MDLEVAMLALPSVGDPGLTDLLPSIGGLID
jgi:hypothetical protein